nr:glycosyltransferase family 4 protein [Maliibacterium massiliense]
MKIIQLAPSISYGDAVSNDIFALDKCIKKMGYRSEIYAEDIDPKLDRRAVKSLRKPYKFSNGDILLFHNSIGSQWSYKVADFSCKKVMVYHNITPPEFFQIYSRILVDCCASGLDGVAYLSDKMDFCLADSQFNKQDLVKAGYTCPIEVLPIIIPLEDYKKQPDMATVEKYSDGRKNFVFVGRISPNKKQEDVIRAFCAYKKYYDKDARLFLVGASKGMERYKARLERYVDALGVEDVYFTGHIPFSQILAYYRIADCFVSMSEHEGFCVPLVEAMCFDVPIVAYDAAAVGETLGGSGLLTQDKSPAVVAALMHRAVHDEALRAQLIAGERERLADFAHDKIEAKFVQYMKRIMS